MIFSIFCSIKGFGREKSVKRSPSQLSTFCKLRLAVHSLKDRRPTTVGRQLSLSKRFIHGIMYFTATWITESLACIRVVMCNPCRSQWPRGLRRRSTAVRLLGSWVWIPPGAWRFVCCECCVCVVRYRSLWRAGPSSREVLPTVVRRCV